MPGGVLGTAPSLRALDDGGNLRHTSDFRRVYAAVLEQWWQLPSERVLQRRFDPLRFIGSVFSTNAPFARTPARSPSRIRLR